MISPALFSSAREDWATPQDFFDTLNAEFHFTLDACANDQNAKCQAYYTKEQDGLAQPWTGTVWCNPPYGREIGAWIAKAYTSACIFGAVVVMLLPARTDTVWFHTWVYPYAEIRFIRGRLKFGGSKNSAPFPSMVAIFRPEWRTLQEGQIQAAEAPSLLHRCAITAEREIAEHKKRQAAYLIDNRLMHRDEWRTYYREKRLEVKKDHV